MRGREGLRSWSYFCGVERMERGGCGMLGRANVEEEREGEGRKERKGEEVSLSDPRRMRSISSMSQSKVR